jgi:alanyl aminopeptidase
VTEAKSTMTLATESCPDWVMPNADGAGYYRFSLPAEQLETLQNGGFEALSAREKLALADSLEASFKNASLSADAVYGSLERFAEADVRPVAQMPMSLVAFARERLVEADAQDAVTRFGGKLYRPAWRRLGWKAGRKDDGEDKLLRASLAKFLTLAMEDKKARRKAAQLGRRFLGYRRGKIDINADAVDDNVVPVVLAVAVQEGDEDLWNAMVEAMFEVEDPSLRDRMLGAISHANGEELAQKVRGFVLDERLRVNEVWEPLQVQMSMPETREATWAWVQENFDTLTERMSKGHSGYLPWLAAGFCSEDKANEVESFFEERVSDLPGGPRNLAGALEAVRLCAARVNAHQEAAREFFR